MAIAFVMLIDGSGAWLTGVQGAKYYTENKTTDSTEFKSAALQAGATIIVKMNSNGQFQIFTQKQDKVNIAEIVEALRIEEHFLRNGETLQLSPAYLQQEGTIPEVSNLFFFMKGGMLLNGSNTANDQPSSVIPFERNVELNVKTFR